MRKALLIVGGLLVVVVGGGGFVATQTPIGDKLRGGFSKSDEATPVRIGQAGRGGITRSISAPGIVTPRTKVEISAQVSARIIALPFEEGDLVRKDDVIVRLDAEDLTARLEAARARLRAQQARKRGSDADLAVALSDLGRKQELHDTGDIADIALEQAQNRYNQAVAASEMATADVEIASAQIIEAERDLANAVISSPIDGVLTTLNAEVGELVMIGTLNNPGSIILEVADLSDMLFEARIDESAIAQVKEDQEATVFVNAYRGEPFEGRVERVGLERKRWTDGTYYYEAEIVVEEEEDRPLLSGLSATAEISVQNLTDVLIVPSQAVLDRRIDELPQEIVNGAGDIVDKRKTFASVVYKIVDGKSVPVPVRIGPSDLADTVILAGLSDGDRVITGPFKTLVGLRHDQNVRDESEPEKPAETTQASDDSGTDAADDDSKPSES